MRRRGATSAWHRPVRRALPRELQLLIAAVVLFGLLVALAPSTVRWAHGLLSTARYPDAQLPAGLVADCAIVLGYALFKDGTPTEPLKGRVRDGLDLYVQGRAQHIIFSGSHPGGNRIMDTEAHTMRALAEHMYGSRQPPVPPGSWFEETSSTSTYENAVFSLRIAKEHGWPTLVVVTSPFHELRSWLVFKRLVEQAAAAVGSSQRQPVRVYMAPGTFTPHAGYPGGFIANRFADWLDFVRELMALYYYHKGGRI